MADRHGNLMTSKWYADAQDTDQVLQVLRDEASTHRLVRVYRRYVDAASGAEAWRLAGVEDDPSARPDLSGVPGGFPEPAPVRTHRFEYASTAPFAMVRATDAVGAVRQFTFVDGKLTRSCDGNGLCVDTTFGAGRSDRRVVKQVQPSGTVVTLDWTKSANVDLTLEWGAPGAPERHTQKFLHGAAQRLTRVYPVDATTLTAREEMDYDAAGHMVRRTDATGIATEWEWDEAGDLRSERLGGSLRHEYTNHDAFGQPRAIRDGDLYETRLDTDPASGDILAVHHVDKDGGATLTTTYSYDARGLPLVTVEPPGATSVQTYAIDGSPEVRFLDSGSLGLSETTFYDWQGNLVQRQGPDGILTQFSYDGNGALTRIVKDPAGAKPHEVAFAYDAEGNLTETRERRSASEESVTRSTFAQVGIGGYKAVRTVGVDGDTVDYRYDQRGRLAAGIERWAQDNFDDRVTTFTYGRLAAGETLDIRGDDGALVEHVETDDSGRVLASRDGRGFGRTYRYDIFGQLIRTEDDLSSVTGVAGTRPASVGGETYFLSRAGRVTASYVNGAAFEYRYDGQGRLSFVGKAPSAVAANEWERRLEYDVAGRAQTVTTTSPLNPAWIRKAKTVYDEIGRVASEQRHGDRIEITTFHYDGAADQNRLALHERSSLDDTARWAYDGVGNVVSVRHGFGPEDATVHGALGESTTRLERDLAGRVTRAILPNGAERTYTWSPGGLKMAESAIEGGTSSEQRWLYSTHGAPRAFVDADGKVTRYGHDRVGRQSSIRYGEAAPPPGVNVVSARGWLDYALAGGLPREAFSSGALAPADPNQAPRTGSPLPAGGSVAFTHLANGLLATMTDSGGTTSYGYDAKNQLVTRARDGRTVSYEYDGQGNVESMAQSANDRTRYGRDAYGVPREIFATGGLGTDERRGYQFLPRYTLGTELTSLQRAQKLSSDDTFVPAEIGSYRPIFTSGFARDTFGRVKDVTHTLAPNNLAPGTDGGLFRTTLSYDYEGHVVQHTRKREAGEQQTFDSAFDPLHRLTGVTQRTEGGRFVERSSVTYDRGGNRTSAGDQTLQYTTADRIGSPGYSYDARGNLIKAPGITYAYDDANRLTRSARSGRDVTYAYDGVGRLIETTVNGKKTKLVLDESREHARVLAVLRPDGRETRYIWGPSGLLGRAVFDTASGQPIAATKPRAVVLGSTSSPAATDAGYKAELIALGYTLDEVPAQGFLGDIAANANRYTSASIVVVLDSASESNLASGANNPLRALSTPVLSLRGDTAVALGFASVGAGPNLGPDGVVGVLSQSVLPIPLGFRPSEQVDGANIVPSSVGLEAEGSLSGGGTAPRRRGLLVGFATSQPASAVAKRALRAALAWTDPRGVFDRPMAFTVIDHLGSVVGETDSKGQMVSETDYDTWGERFSTSSSAPLLDGLVLGYTGEWHNPDSTVHLRARTYDPALGSFLQRDSFAGTPDRATSLNRYAYAEGDPLSFADPSGHMVVTGSGLDSQIPDRQFANSPNSYKHGDNPWSRCFKREALKNAAEALRRIAELWPGGAKGRGGQWIRCSRPDASSAGALRGRTHHRFPRENAELETSAWVRGPRRNIPPQISRQ